MNTIFFQYINTLALASPFVLSSIDSRKHSMWTKPKGTFSPQRKAISAVCLPYPHPNWIFDLRPSTEIEMIFQRNSSEDRRKQEGGLESCLIPRPSVPHFAGKDPNWTSSSSFRPKGIIIGGKKSRLALLAHFPANFLPAVKSAGLYVLSCLLLPSFCHFANTAVAYP